ncbi:hypothetical protein AGDE_08680 [Angomonas deanei]|nr:hypothetical protein AGDE_08680 [Angomonas deanei]|eukprot:EPY32453.1 hypothetical protein AGDE_08680 [Angomonas deanei]
MFRHSFRIWKTVSPALLTSVRYQSKPTTTTDQLVPRHEGNNSPSYTNEPFSAALVGGNISGSEMALPSPPTGSRVSARNIATETLQMKKIHQERGANPMLAQQARRVLFATTISGQSVDARTVAVLLSTAVYFGMESDARIVRECVDYCLKNDKFITLDVLPIVVTACANLKSRDAREVIELQAIKATRNARYLDPKRPD